MIQDIAYKINDLSRSHRIRQLQSIRKRIKGFDRRPGSSIFADSTISEDGEWAFHFGGRKELQFNIGIEKEGLRYGVALSLEPSQTLPNISLLYPKARRLNQFIRQYPDFFSEYSMWHWSNEGRSEIGPVTQITDDLLRPKTFIFLGKLQEMEHIDYEVILTTFDELLKPYVYVEKNAGVGIIEDEIDTTEEFQFEPNRVRVAQEQIYTLEQKSVNLSIRHSLIQSEMVRKLEARHGFENVSVEQEINGKKIDIVLRDGCSYQFFEIKTSGSAKACIRDAIGQLMEYAYWPGRINAKKLIVVGEEEIDQKTNDYMTFIRGQFSLPVEYERVEIE